MSIPFKVSRRVLLSTIVGLVTIGIYSISRKATHNDKHKILTDYIEKNCNKYNISKLSQEYIKSYKISGARKDQILSKIFSGNYTNVDELESYLIDIYAEDYSHEKYIFLNNWILSETEAVVCILMLAR